MRKIIFALIFSFGSLFAFEHLTVDNIDKKLEGKNTIVDFYATWCPPCKVVAKNLIAFDKQKPKDITIYKVDIDQQLAIAKKYGIRSLPTLVYIKDGKVQAKEIGIKNVGQLRQNSQKYFK